MFDVGFWELAIIGIVALVIVGPERLPGLARTAGLWVGKGRRMLADVKRDIDREIKASEMAELQELKQDIEKTGKEIAKAGETIKSESGVDEIKESLNDTTSLKNELIGDDSTGDDLKDDLKQEMDEIDAVSRQFDDELAGDGQREQKGKKGQPDATDADAASDSGDADKHPAQAS